MDSNNLRRQLNLPRTPAEATEHGHRPLILAVGDLESWNRAGRPLPADSHITYADFVEVTDGLLYSLRPDMVLSPLLSTRFDCIDLAQLLLRLGFSGRYRAMTPPLPNPDIVRREIRSLCPGLDFDLVMISESTPARLS